MDEREWLNDFYPLRLVEFASALVGRRKLRLFACACARAIERHRPSASGRRLIQMREEFADAQVEDIHKVVATIQDFVSERPSPLHNAIDALFADDPHHAPRQTIRELIDLEANEIEEPSNDRHLALVREVFGSPFRPVDFAPWRTGTAVLLARQMYDSRDFDAIPILADALQDAGCDNDEVLNHCRDAGPHVRGCWVVDGVLGLE